MTGPDHDVVGDAAVLYLAYLSRDVSAPPDLGALEPEVRRRADTVLAALDAAWHAGDFEPPPIAQDRTAITLGLVPDPSRALSGPALRAARQRAKLSVSDLAARLRDRGWDTQTSDVYQWEQKPAAAANVPPAVINALADEVRVPERNLATTPPPLRSDVAAVSATSRFHELARRWSTAMSLGSDAQAGAVLQQLMLAGAVRRGSELSTKEWLAALEALLQTHESARENQ